MKSYLSFLILSFTLFSCSSVDSIKKSSNCIVWKDQKYMGPYSVDVIAKKIEWTGACIGYNRGCQEIVITLDENNNVLSGAENLGKIENGELKFSEKHSLSEVVNFTGIRAYPEQKLVKSSVVVENVSTEQSFSFNNKCSAEEAVAGVVALSLIEKAQSKDRK